MCNTLTSKSDPAGSSPSSVASPRYIRELDGIRAIAVSVVVIAHYGLGFVVPGGFGVTLFFFLSGYLITTLFFAEYTGNGAISVPQFYLRRWLRLTPPLIISIVFAVAFYPLTRHQLGGSPVPLGTTLAALFYYTNYYDLYYHLAPAFVTPFAIFWSLAVEEHFYLAWPWVIRRNVGDPRRLCLLIAGTCIAVLAWRCVSQLLLVMPPDYTYSATDCRIDSILYGALLRVFFETPWSAAVIRYLRAPKIRIIAVLALLATFVIRNGIFRETLRYSIQGMALMPFFVAVLVGKPNTLLRRVLGSAPLVLIGKLSYSIYLFHTMLLSPGEVYFGPQHRVATIISGVLLTGLVAFALFILVERPIAGVRHRLRTTANPVAASSTSTALAEEPVIAFPHEPRHRGRRRFFIRGIRAAERVG